MHKFAANVDWMFCELPFLDRFEAAAVAGFEGVEFLFPYDYAPTAIAHLLERHRLTNVLFNFPPGNWSAGEKGIAALPGREAEFRDSVDCALSYAAILKTRQLHVLSGIIPAEAGRMECREVYLENLRYAADKAEPQGITLLVEAINPVDVPNYLVQTQAESFEICAAADRKNIRMQLDLYHMQRSEEGLEEGLRKYHTLYSHVQIAGVPGRHEPDVGFVDYPRLFNLLDELGYGGWIGCEYRPLGNTLDGLNWYRNQAR